MLKITSNALVTLVRAEQDCFKELFEAVDITRRTRIPWKTFCSFTQTPKPKPSCRVDQIASTSHLYLLQCKRPNYFKHGVSDIAGKVLGISFLQEA